MLIYLLLVSPFLDKNMQRSVISGEACIFLVYTILLLPFISGANLSVREQGFICIMIVLANIGLCILFSVNSAVMVLYKRLKAKRINALNMIMPTTGDVITEKY